MWVIVRALFVFEAALNVVASTVCVVFPLHFLGAFSDVSLPTLAPVVIDVVRWYGISLFVLSAILVALFSNSDAFSFCTHFATRVLCPALIALAIGDVAQCVVLWRLSCQMPWTLASLGTFVISLVLLCCRVVWLVSHHRASSCKSS